MSRSISWLPKAHIVVSIKYYTTVSLKRLYLSFRCHYLSNECHSITFLNIVMTSKYQLDRWKSSEWQRETRYYLCELKQDLFGKWVVVRSWGSRKLRQKMEIECSDYSEAESVYDRAMKRRIDRGYECTLER